MSISVRRRAFGAAALLAALACHGDPAAPNAGARTGALMPVVAAPYATPHLMPPDSVGDVSARMSLAPRGAPSLATGTMAGDVQLVWEHPVNGDHVYWRMHGGALASTG